MALVNELADECDFELQRLSEAMQRRFAEQCDVLAAQFTHNQTGIRNFRCLVCQDSGEAPGAQGAERHRAVLGEPPDARQHPLPGTQGSDSEGMMQCAWTPSSRRACSSSGGGWATSSATKGWGGGSGCPATASS